MAGLLELKGAGNRALSRLWAGTLPAGHRVAGPFVCHTSTEFCNFDLRVIQHPKYLLYLPLEFKTFSPGKSCYSMLHAVTSSSLIKRDFRDYLVQE